MAGLADVFLQLNGLMDGKCGWGNAMKIFGLEEQIMDRAFIQMRRHIGSH
jgi:hypothetical protein